MLRFYNHLLGDVKSAKEQKNVIACIFGALAVLFVAVFTYVTWKDYNQTVATAHESTAGLAVVLEEHTERSLEAVELTLETIARDLSGTDITAWRPSRGEWEKYRTLAARLPQVSSYAIFDRNGDSRLITTEYPWPKLAAAERDYFIEHRDRGLRTYLGSTFIARFNGKPIFTYGIRLEDAQGNFNGVLVASMEIGYFRHFYRSLDVGPNGSIAIVRSDGKSILREPLVVASRFRDLSKDKLFTDMLPRSMVGTFTNTSPFDGQKRIAAYRASKTRPFVVVAAKSDVELLRPVWMRLMISGTGLAVVLLLLYMLARFLTRNVEREAQHSRDLAQSRDFADAILDSVTSHIVIVDRDGTVRRTNRAWRSFAQENGYQGDPSFIGQNYLAQKNYGNVGDLRSVYNGIRSVMEGSSTSFEVEYPCHSPCEERWFNMRVSPLEREAGSVVIVHENVSRLKQIEEKFRVLATRDELTGLSNRRALFGIGEAEFERAHRYGNDLSVVMLDCDHFKRVNDSFGHEAGDKVLVHFAVTILQTVRNPDHAGRLGGEEFIVILPHTGLDGASQFAERLRQTIATHPADTGNINIWCTASFGVAQMTGEMQTFTDLLKEADLAMYRAKDAGRNCVMN